MLETVPEQLWGERSVLASAEKRGLHPRQMLLDRSLHHKAMLRLKDGWRRGRPDLVHQAVLSVTGTPAYLNGEVKLYIHTYNNLVVEVMEKTRLPKSYFRFQGLMEKALAEHSGGRLVKIRESAFKDLVEQIGSEDVVGFSRRGVLVEPREWLTRYAQGDEAVFVVGGFPRGGFSRGVLEHLTALISIHPMPLEAHVVLARVIYEYEKFRSRV